MHEPNPAQSPPGDVTEAVRVTIDFGADTGAFHGGATGTLYGLGDVGVPSLPLIEGMRPATVAQKAAHGLQHPTGDAVATADGYFDAGGGEVLVYMQDVYAQWPYEQLGTDDFVAKARVMVAEVAARPDRDRFAWVPFNEPDWIWYGDWAADRERFFADWRALVGAIRETLPSARIVGPNEMRFNPDRLRDFLRWAATERLLPDVMAWHELVPESLTDYPEHFAAYRDLERELGIDPLPINIDEYGNRRDFSVPSRLVEWIAMLEATKVDADMAYWTFAGNLDDHAVRAVEANGGWWLLKWYADLTGRTAAVAGGRSVATLDADRAQATVLIGGAVEDREVEVTGLAEGVFGSEIDVTRTVVTWSGYEGAAIEPAPADRQRIPFAASVRLMIPGGDPLAAHRVVITPAEQEADTRRAVPVSSFEAEEARIVDGVIRRHDDDPQKYTTSGARDVAALVQPTSSVTFTVPVPSTGRWRIGVFYGTDRAVGHQALFVDGAYDRELVYPATLSHTYRGRLDVELDLPAGEHELSFRAAGPDGPLPSGDVALDRIDVAPAQSHSAVVTARTARLEGTAQLVAGSPDAPAVVRLAQDAEARFLVAASASGYHDVVLDGSGDDARLTLTVNDRPVVTDAAPPADRAWSARVHLGVGVSVVGVTATAGSVDLAAVRVSPADQDGAPPWLPAAALATAGGARTEPSDTVEGGALLRGLEAGTATLPEDGGDGALDLVLRYGSAALVGGHDYNTDVVSTSLTVRAGEGRGTEVRFGPTHAWDSVAEVVVPVQRRSGDPVVLAGGDPAPSIAAVRLVPFVHSHAFGPEEGVNRERR